MVQGVLEHHDGFMALQVVKGFQKAIIWLYLKYLELTQNQFSQDGARKGDQELKLRLLSF